MRSTTQKSNTRVLGAPLGWDQKALPCDALPITDSSINGQPCVISYWKPEPGDIAHINEGGLVAIAIIGQNMPPISVYVTEDVPKDE